LSKAAGLYVKTRANSDHACVDWKSSARIDGCRGFVTVRRGSQDEEGMLKTWVGSAATLGFYGSGLDARLIE